MSIDDNRYIQDPVEAEKASTKKEMWAGSGSGTIGGALGIIFVWLLTSNGIEIDQMVNGAIIFIFTSGGERIGVLIKAILKKRKLL